MTTAAETAAAVAGQAAKGRWAPLALLLLLLGALQNLARGRVFGGEAQRLGVHARARFRQQPCRCPHLLNESNCQWPHPAHRGVVDVGAPIQ